MSTLGGWHLVWERALAGVGEMGLNNGCHRVFKGWGRNESAVHLHDRRTHQEARAEGSSEEHLARVLSGGQNWSARVQRGWEKYPAPNHGGVDKQFDGTARLASGFVAGYLSQEPQLNPEKDVQGNVEEAVASRRQVLDRYNEISMELGTDIDEAKMQKLCDEMARLQDVIDSSNLWELDSKSRQPCPS